ncbi:uncharacterized protein BDR25DRAFT_277172 [Lindgomyces ingoldianus]|uniref:Uncharacterized protein n=1 Tax=Lindgomyces ingoldianus TaxID=673940 RepID=A0ACB6RCY4_9PLEO|nr:uncharacterized protein BDR25DRAFT_277172 [Lindgomyces ingoldianus]KAF2476180.1 hypothetical protein BDR25DRAFT_277172 [Lindgomyces ingoldianus]
MDANYSIYSIPVYWFLALVPHAFAVQLMKGANNKKWDNANPRGADANAKYQKAVPNQIWCKFERAEAAHKNMLESAPLFIGAILAGNIAGLPKSTLNTAAGAYLGLRVAYIAIYINVANQKLSMLRSATWAISTGVLFRLLIQAGNKLAF